MDPRPLQTCAFATNTGEPWCFSWLPCTKVECRCKRRFDALKPNGEGRTDAAAFHTHNGDGFLIVRSGYCCQQHCIDYEKRA